MSFMAALENAILEQRANGIVCPLCDKTRVEHYYRKAQTCGSLDRFTDRPPNGKWLYEWEEIEGGGLSSLGRLQKSNRQSSDDQIKELESLMFNSE